MVSCLMGDSTALASAIVRCCPLYAAVVFLLVLGPFPEDMGNTMVYHTELHNRKTRVFHRKNKGFHSFLP